MNSEALRKARRFSVAPMMDWTDRHCRVLHRQLTRHALLFTEMVTSAAIVHGDRERLLGFRGRRAPAGRAARRIRSCGTGGSHADRDGLRL